MRNFPKFNYHHMEPMTIITNSSPKYKTELEDIHSLNLTEFIYVIKYQLNSEVPNRSMYNIFHSIFANQKFRVKDTAGVYKSIL